jgi:threonine/homoserine/homoserine lactone efflux protein
VDTALALFGISALVIVTPGQDTVLTIRNTLLGGRVGGTFTAVGVALGQAIWTLAAKRVKADEGNWLAPAVALRATC